MVQLVLLKRNNYNVQYNNTELCKGEDCPKYGTYEYVD